LSELLLRESYVEEQMSKRLFVLSFIVVGFSAIAYLEGAWTFFEMVTIMFLFALFIRVKRIGDTLTPSPSQARRTT